MQRGAQTDMHSFIDTITQMFFRAVVPALAVMAAGGIVLALLYWKWYGKETRLTLRRSTAILLLLCYLGGLAAVTLLLRVDGCRTGVQTHLLLAFWEAWNTFTFQVWLNPLLNIAMFLPLGVLLPLAARPFRKWYRMLAAGAGTSLVIEALQYLLGRGQADVDDLFCNTLGAMLGYCLCMLAVCLKEKQWKLAGACAALPVLSAAVLGGIFLAYRLQPYGNLAGAPAFTADTSGTEWVLECELSDQPGPSGVYWTEPFTKESCDAFAVEFLGRVGAEIDFDGPDVDYYDNTTYYSDHHTYSLIVNHNDCSYQYSDYRVDSDLRYSEEKGTATEQELRAALEGLGIHVPDAAQFIDEGRGRYVFRAERVVDGGALIDGELTCRVAKGGLLYEVDNAFSAGALHGDAAVLSEREACERLRAGRFSQPEVFYFEQVGPREVHVISCDLQYLTDSKGFRQPVYSFTLSDERDGELRNGSRWCAFVPALAG